MNIKLNKVDIDFLRKELNASLFNQLKLTLNRDNYDVEASVDALADIQDVLSDLLMIKGFDKDYKPNGYGLKIENLIDKFSPFLNG